MPTSKAISLAEGEGLDLVCMNANSNPPVCKIFDYGKYKFDSIKREKEARKNQKVTELKEIQLSMTIDTHDLEVKAKHGKRFLEDGNKVKITVRFRGREVNNSKAGELVLNKFIEALEDVAVVEKAPKLEGRNMFTILAKKA